MTRREKIKKKILRAKARAEKHNKKYREETRKMDWEGCPRQGMKIGGYWADSSSPTGYMQVCSYQGHCQYPCNGDC